jgi:hypothetical protein
MHGGVAVADAGHMADDAPGTAVPARHPAMGGGGKLR